MEKTWEQMDQREKIEDLRGDVKRIFGLLNQYRDAIATDQQAFRSQIAGLEQFGPLIHALHARVRQLEERAGGGGT